MSLQVSNTTVLTKSKHWVWIEKMIEDFTGEVALKISAKIWIGLSWKTKWK